MMAAENSLHLMVFMLAAVNLVPALALYKQFDYKDAQEDVVALCPLYTWGANCELSCINCSDNCDQEFGVCRHCKAGYKYPLTACSQACDIYEYGVNCEGNCLRKCGTDCLERENGTCPSIKNVKRSMVLKKYTRISLGHTFFYKAALVKTVKAYNDGPRKTSFKLISRLAFTFPLPRFIIYIIFMDIVTPLLYVTQCLMICILIKFKVRVRLRPRVRIRLRLMH